MDLLDWLKFELSRGVSNLRGWTATKILEGFDLAGKVFLITGVGRSLGFEMSKELIDHRATVIVAYEDLERES